MKLKPGYQTNDAIVLAEKAVNGTAKLTPTRAVLSSDDYSNASDDTIMALKTLNSFAEVKIDYGANVDPETINFPIKFDNTQMTQDNYVKSIGIYFSDGTNEYLYSVLVNTDPELFPAYNGSVPQTLKFNWGVFVGRSSQVSVTLSDMDNVTEDQLAQTVSSLSANTKSLADSAYSHASTDLSNYASNNDLKSSVAVNASNISSNSSLIATKANSSDLSNAVTNFENELGTKVTDNKDGTITFNGNTVQVEGVIDENTDLFTINQRGVWKSRWGFQKTLKNFPSEDGAAVIIASSSSEGKTTGLKLTVIDSWGNMFESVFAADHFSPWQALYSAGVSTKADKAYVDSQTALQFDNAIKQANAYTDKNSVLNIPPNQIASGDSFDNYAGKLVRLNINLVYLPSISAGLGLPTAVIKGTFTSIPSANLTEQWIVDDWGNRWYRVTGQAWTQIFTSNLGSVHDYKIHLTGLNGMDVSGAYGIWSPNSKTITLYGKAIYTASETNGESIFSFDASGLGMNEITAQNYGSDTLSASMDAFLKHVVVSRTSGQAVQSGWTYWFVLDGHTITLGYDSTLKPNYNSLNAQLIGTLSTNNSDSAYSTNTLYYLQPGFTLSNDQDGSSQSLGSLDSSFMSDLQQRGGYLVLGNGYNNSQLSWLISSPYNRLAISNVDLDVGYEFADIGANSHGDWEKHTH